MIHASEAEFDLSDPDFTDPDFLARVRRLTWERRRPVFEGAPVILVACGGAAAEVFVRRAVADFHVVGLIDNSRKGSEAHGFTFGGNDDLHDLMQRYPDAVGISCSLSEAGIHHFRDLWGQRRHALLSWFEVIHEISATGDVSDLIKLHLTFCVRTFSAPERVARLRAALRPRLVDEESRRVLDALLLYRLTWIPIEGVQRPAGDIYFDTDLCPLAPDEIFLDGGAFDGDTIAGLKRASGDRFGHIHAFEIDPVNLSALKDNTLHDPRITAHGIGLWDEPGDIGFEVRGDMGSAVNPDSEIRVPVDALDNMGLPPMTFVKLDIEGAEAHALRGMKRLIVEHKPKLAVCAYHRPDDLADLPDVISGLRADYRFALRHYSSVIWESVLYAA